LIQSKLKPNITKKKTAEELNSTTFQFSSDFQVSASSSCASDQRILESLYVIKMITSLNAAFGSYLLEIVHR
jgi:hypothetical protein